MKQRPHAGACRADGSRIFEDPCAAFDIERVEHLRPTVAQFDYARTHADLVQSFGDVIPQKTTRTGDQDCVHGLEPQVHRCYTPPAPTSSPVSKATLLLFRSTPASENEPTPG